MISTLYKTFQHWSSQGRVLLISDPHFDDEDCKLMNPNWPSAEEYITKLNKVITKNDTLVCLGDVGKIKWVRKLKAGHKVLVTGNHDHNKSYYQRSTFYNYDDILKYGSEKNIYVEYRKKYPGYKIDIESNILAGNYGTHTIYRDNNLFDEVYDGPLFISDRILLSHEPVIGLPFCLNIHGHSHGLWESCIYLDYEGGYHLNLAADVQNWTVFDLGKEIKNGLLAGIDNIHRQTIDNAIEHSIKLKEKN